MAGLATKSCDDLAFEAIELIRKNMSFRVQTKGHTWDCTLTPKNEQYVSSDIRHYSTLTYVLVTKLQLPVRLAAHQKGRRRQA
jgi:hypothetical protein